MWPAEPDRPTLRPQETPAHARLVVQRPKRGIVVAWWLWTLVGIGGWCVAGVLVIVAFASLGRRRRVGLDRTPPDRN
jgi:hypothetical protein